MVILEAFVLLVDRTCNLRWMYERNKLYETSQSSYYNNDKGRAKEKKWLVKVSKMNDEIQST